MTAYPYMGVFTLFDIVVELHIRSVVYVMKRIKKVKISLKQAVEAHRVVRRRGSHIF
jgi:hypothetical protein